MDRVAPGFPDAKTCLLYQKLQMLNICMERRRIREGGLPFSMTQQKQANSTTEYKNESEDDEFYDCVDDEDLNSNENIVPWNKPVGRLSKLSNLTIIDSNESLYVPITQESVPKTEDQLEDDAEVILKLGPGSELCTQMMSASLLSDMESFKAANPNGKLEDFIRWYSPRDWIEEINENGIITGHLSHRMLIAGNTWQKVWSSAKPVAARRQKRLFDDTKEAEKVLNYFETRTVAQICQLTIAPLFHSVFLKLEDELKKSNMNDVFNEHMDRIKINLCKLSHENWLLSNTTDHMHVTSSIKKWERLLNEIETIEQKNLKAKSLAYKLFDDYNKNGSLKSEVNKKLILLMLEGNETIIPGAAKNNISVRILNIFANVSKLENQSEKEKQKETYLPDPIRKEYILRVDGITTKNEIGGPQYLRAILDENMRLCGAFSENTTFL